MKRLLALMLAAALALSLVACGGGETGGTNTPSTGNGDTISTDTPSSGNSTPQLDAESAIPETPKHVYKDVIENQARAMQNTYLMNCTVYTITDTYFETDYGLQICLPVEQLAQLNKGDDIAIIGQITDVKDETIEGTTTTTTIIIIGIAEIYDGIVPDVAPREDEIFIGVLVGEYSGTWNIQIVGSSSTKPIYFADGENISALKNDDAIIFTADIWGLVNNPEYYKDAKIIEIMSLEEMDRYLAGIS